MAVLRRNRRVYEEIATSALEAPGRSSRRPNRWRPNRGARLRRPNLPGVAAASTSEVRGSRTSVTVNVGPLPDPALHVDPAAVHVDDRLDDREPKAASRAPRLVRRRAAVEPLEDVRELGRVDPHPRVADRDLGAVAVGRTVTRHRRTRAG